MNILEKHGWLKNEFKLKDNEPIFTNSCVDKLRWLLSLTSIYFDIDTIYRLGMKGQWTSAYQYIS